MTAEPSPGEALRSLGVDGETGRPLAALDGAVVRRRAEELLLRPRPPRYGVPADDLFRAGWGVVLPETADPSWREALEPLLALRRRQAGDRYRELTYRTDEDALQFRRRLGSAHGPVDPESLPWYLLMVGSPVDLPHGFEMDLRVPCAVGRLDFDDPEDLRAYAERVVTLEENGSRPGRPSGLVFAPTHPGDPGTEITSEHLARPLADLAASRLHLETEIGRGATRARLVELLGTPRDLFLFAGHAVQYTPGHDLQRTCQGALLCADWPGPEQWPEGSPLEHVLPAEAVPEGALAGGIAVLVGCYTAGTATVDPYDSTDPDAATPLAPEPFTAALAHRLLGRRGGALGVLGHVGRTFEVGIFWQGARQTVPLEDAIRALLDGRRIGLAVDGFGARFADLAVTWARTRLGARELEAPDLLNLWIAFHDAHSWCLLGDPAVRPFGAPG